jgi:hypothetical protein
MFFAFGLSAAAAITLHSIQTSDPHPGRMMSRSPTPDRSSTDTRFRDLAQGETYTFTPSN